MRRRYCDGHSFVPQARAKAAARSLHRFAFATGYDRDHGGARAAQDLRNARRRKEFDSDDTSPKARKPHLFTGFDPDDNAVITLW
jgi:hypothetical protein